MQVLKKIQLLLSLIPKVYRMPPQVNNPAMTQEKKIWNQATNSHRRNWLSTECCGTQGTWYKNWDLGSDVCAFLLFDDKKVLCRWRLSQNFCRSGERIFLLGSRNLEKNYTARLASDKSALGSRAHLCMTKWFSSAQQKLRIHDVIRLNNGQNFSHTHFA